MISPEPPISEPTDARLATLLRRLADDARTLVRQEIDLAKLEVTQAAVALARGSAVAAVGVVLLAIGLVVLLVFAILALGRLLGDRYWLSTLIFGALFALAGIVLIVRGRGTIRSAGLKPDVALDTVRETGDWAKTEAVELRNELKNRE